jgi:proteic killer suppression protein
MDIHVVLLSAAARRQLLKLPKYIVFKLQAWIDGVQVFGLHEMRKIPGFHDEPLKGDRKGQRSIRLSKSYRAIYMIDQEGVIKFIEIVEVHKHDY